MPRFDLVGQFFGRLTVVAFAGRMSARDTWSCACACGKAVVVRQNNLKSGNTTSCGCAHVKHGRAKKDHRDETYNSWQSMIARVDGQRGARTAKSYSDRGISMCERWRSFACFLADMGPRPAGRSLDRINNNGGYEPGNCRWATRTEQQRNRRCNVVLLFNGRSACLSEWADSLGLSRSTLRKRINSGWSVESALTAPTNL
jgi:hypothetical protein